MPSLMWAYRSSRKYGQCYTLLYINYLMYFSRVHANLAGTLSGHASWVLSVAFSPDGKRFVSGSADRTVRVWELETMQCQNVFKEHTDQVYKDLSSV